ncbi:MAG: hypothetical protein CVU03_07610 [Bacteroidetes bacterium HGW-Bacteroidetes-2]|jgi:hypothetical protein|nr:MAG: hypothetical protein CVU03_07610 [Bacteroidetes bacterium HGW-Bacteroidetes-2]
MKTYFITIVIFLTIVFMGQEMKPETQRYSSLISEFSSYTINSFVHNTNESIEDYSNWLFISSDKDMQVRYKLEKQEGNIGYFSVQFRINFEDKSSCYSSNCEGYYFTFGYPTLDLMNNIYSHYKFYNTFKDIYTMPELIPLNLKTRNGSYIYLKKEGFFFMFNNNELQANMFYNCVDEILSGNALKNRCSGPGSYRNIYEDSKAISIK